MSKQLDWPYVINLGNSILGVSILAMPFCFRQCGVLLGVLLLLASAWLTGVACELLMKSAVTSKKRSYEYLALHTFGPLGKLAVEVSIIGMLLGTCVAFHVIIGDLGPAIISKILGLENTAQLRTSVMVILGLFIGLPLGLLKNIESLSNVSAISIGFYMVFVAEVFASAFPNLWSGIWVAKVEVWNPEGVFKCLPIFSLAYGCQTQLFVMYDALPEPSIKRMNSISKNAISLCTGVYLLVGFFGYMAFCDEAEAISGDILVNFRPTIFSEAVKLGFVMSVAVSFPLVIFPCRTSIHTLLFAKVSEQHAGTHENFGGSPVVPEPHFKLITIAIVLSTLIVGIYLPNIEFILAITGATMGSMICYIFPAVLFITLMSMSKNSSKSTAQLVLFLGVTILLASTYTTLYSQDQRVPDTVDSVVKVAEPQPIKPVEKGVIDNSMGAGDAPNVQPNKNIKDGDDVIKDNSKDKTGGNQVEETKPAGIQKDDRRQEPPNPHTPVDDKPQSKEELKEEVKLDDNGQNGDKKPEDQRSQKAPEKQGMDEKRDSDVEQKPKQDIIPGKRKVNATGEKTEKELKEAKVLLEELKEQRDEQKKLLDAQRELINELKQHQKEAHPDIQNQKPVDDENVGFQRAGGVAPHDDGTVLAANVKKQVEEEVAKVVKNAVDAQQEEQLHNIAKQNHQEMLESLDGQKQQLNQLPGPADVNNGGMAQPNVQTGQILQQQQPVLDAAPDIKQGGNVNFVQQQADNNPQNLAHQQVIGQQPQEASKNVPPVVGKQPQIVDQQPQRQASQQVQVGQNSQVQGAANNFLGGNNKQPIDTLDTLKLGQRNLDPQIQVNNNPVQGQPVQRMQDAGLNQQQPVIKQNVQHNVILPNVQNLNKPDIGKQSINSPMRNKR